MIDELVRRQIVRHLSSGPRTFPEILAVCWGAFPADVKRVLVGLADQNIVLCESDKFRIAQAEVNLAHPAGLQTSGEIARRFHEIVRGWPDPHQSNYEWRFTFDAASVLLTTLESLCGLSPRVCFMGCPTPFILASLAKLFDSILLLDNSTPTTAYIGRVGLSGQVRQHDLLLGLPDELAGCFDAVVLDPPWYPEYYATFLDASSRAVVKGGYVLCTLLPLCTRETAATERAGVLQIGFECGLSTLSLREGILAYETPRFEAKTLALHGFDGLPTWRQADLLVFFKIAGPSRSVPAIVRPSSWQEWVLGKCVVRLRPATETAEKDRIMVPIEGKSALLPSVSRTYERILEIGLWTSSNHAYRVNRPDVVGRMLHWMSLSLDANEVKHAVLNEFSPDSEAERLAISSAVDELFNAVYFS